MNPRPSSADSNGFRCPTCGARQDLSPTCRRCKCDLSLVVAAHRRRQALRRQCLLEIGRRRGPAARQAADELYRLAPDADSARLLAVAHLLCGDYVGALHTAR